MSDDSKSLVEKLCESFRTVKHRLKNRSSLKFFSFSIIGGVSLIVMLAGGPALHPIVRVPGGAFSLKLECVPAQIDILLGGGKIPVKRVGATIRPTPNETETPQLNATQSLIQDAEATHINIVPAPVHNKPGELANRTVDISIPIDGLPYVDIQKATISNDTKSADRCNARVLEGDDLKNLIRSAYEPRLMKYHRIQEVYSNWILALNDLAATVIVCLMTLALMNLAYRFGTAYLELYFVSDDTIRDRIATRLTQAPPALKALGPLQIIKADFYLLYRRLVFARVIGPALGFTLTVSSLIAGLHPTGQTLQSTFQLLSSLQVAMVATLVGLLMRIVAEFALRLHTSCAERRIELCPECETKPSAASATQIAQWPSE